MKTYKVKLNLQHNKNLTPLDGIPNYAVRQTPEGFLILGAPDAYRVKGRAVRRMRDGYIEHIEKGSKDQSLFRELYKAPQHLDDPRAFLDRYESLIGYKANAKAYQAKIGTSVKLSYQEGFGDFDGELIWLSPDEDKWVEPLSDSFLLSSKALLNLEEGYYTILPRDSSQSPSGAPMTFEGTETFKIDGWVTKRYVLPPNSSLVPKVDTDCVNPLVKGLDANRRYILFRASEEDLKPFCLLSLDGVENEVITKLLASHEEFLRPYYYVADSTAMGTTEGFEEEWDKLKATTPIYKL